ncbi:uncharacterized protein BX663DRAFT_497190 [Cokeromyces recurvatus]|uniref:uncharacterized protein n=1 Tax=Cokeromyces recurvatus TaxID=90255 RepID=UPI00221F807B|nr:uncharacterized protein BX663DRAFT_497190 [Cokeromyces recurvatus]KAI7906650.1 hypothetical protein BX663DRAFT_497190 [Cokeromyces recurvatus]
MSRSSLIIKFFNFLVITLLLVSHITTAQKEEIKEQEAITNTNLTVYHQKDGQYIKRGIIVGLPGVPEYHPTKNEIVDFQKGSFYQIKVKDERTGKIYIQSVKMCQMVDSDWNDEFILHLDENNIFYHVDYYASSNDCSEETIKYPITTKPFTSVIRVVQPIAGPKPLIGHFGGSASQHKKTQSKSKKPTAVINDEIPEHTEIEEKSFFQKYWYLILAGMFLLTSLAGSAPPEDSPSANRRR